MASCGPMRIAKEATWPGVGKRPNFLSSQEFGHANNPLLLHPEGWITWVARRRKLKYHVAADSRVFQTPFCQAGQSEVTGREGSATSTIIVALLQWHGDYWFSCGSFVMSCEILVCRSLTLFVCYIPFQVAATYCCLCHIS